MTTKYGDFLPPKFNCQGDCYASRQKPGDRDMGLAFIATTGKRGKNNDACFDKAKILYEGEKYVDPSRRQLLANKEKKRGMVSETPFRMSSPMKLSTGLGDFQGTLQGKLEYIAGSPEVKLKKGDVQDSKPNLYTSPGKKGSYGFNKTTLSERRGAGGMQGEYTYSAEPYDAARKAAADERQAAPKVSEAPFVPSNPAKKGGYGYSKTNLGNKAAGVSGEFGYQPHSSGSSAVAPECTAKFETPFVPPRAPRSGYNRTLAKYPEHYADPDQLKADARRQARALETAALAAGQPWHPAAVPKMAATRSVMRMNI